MPCLSQRKVEMTGSKKPERKYFKNVYPPKRIQKDVKLVHWYPPVTPPKNAYLKDDELVSKYGHHYEHPEVKYLKPTKHERRSRSAANLNYEERRSKGGDRRVRRSHSALRYSSSDSVIRGSRDEGYDSAGGNTSLESRGCSGCLCDCNWQKKGSKDSYERRFRSLQDMSRSESYLLDMLESEQAKSQREDLWTQYVRRKCLLGHISQPVERAVSMGASEIKKMN